MLTITLLISHLGKFIWDVVTHRLHRPDSDNKLPQKPPESLLSTTRPDLSESIIETTDKKTEPVLLFNISSFDEKENIERVKGKGALEKTVEKPETVQRGEKGDVLKSTDKVERGVPVSEETIEPVTFTVLESTPKIDKPLQGHKESDLDRTEDKIPPLLEELVEDSLISEIESQIIQSEGDLSENMASVHDIDVALTGLSLPATGKPESWAATQYATNTDSFQAANDVESEWTSTKTRKHRGIPHPAAASADVPETARSPLTAAKSARTAVDSSITLDVRKSNRFPFIVHDETVNYVNASQVMFVMRGLPGSGKSTIVKLLQETYPHAVSCSADDHFLQPDGTYMFRVDGLSDAHEACQAKSRDACERGCPVVIIDNTNVRMWEMSKYVEMAARHDYTLVTVEPRTTWSKDARELARKNKHGVSEEIIRRKVQQYDEGIPLYYGWFLNRPGSRQIMGVGEQYFRLLMENCPGFNLMINQVKGGSGPLTMGSIYGREGSSSDRLHCTAFYANRGRIHTSSAYHCQPYVVQAMGRTFALEVVGFVFTGKTAGVRIRLPAKLMPLWGKDDREGMLPSFSRGGPGRGARSDSRNWRSKGRITDSPPRSSVTSPCDATQQQTSRYQPVVGEGSRAHFTLGYTRNSKAVQTGFDLQEVVKHEARNIDRDTEKGVVKVDGATVKLYDGDFWVIYLDEPVPIQTLFSGRY